jgi:hypothetical protein
VGGPERRDVSFRKIAAALKPQNRGIGYKRRRQSIQAILELTYPN